MTQTPRNILGTVGPRVNHDAVATSLLSLGATYSLTGAAYRGGGFVVAVEGHGAMIGLDVLELHALTAAWVRDVAAPAIHSRPAPFHPSRYVGSWVDWSDRVLYLDVVEVFPPDQYDAAMAAARTRGEAAIFDTLTGQTIFVD